MKEEPRGWHYRGYLPHFDGGELAQFVTFRVADGLRGEPLSDPRLAEVVEGALLHFDGERYRLHAWVIMPNHVHVLLIPRRDNHVSDIVHSWKSFTSKRANRLLGRNGQFWQEDYLDRYIRDQSHFDATLEYIEQNPVKAGLCRNPQDWPFRGTTSLRQPTTPGQSTIPGPWASCPQAAKDNVSDLRKEYVQAGLKESEAHLDPVEQFRKWFDEALAADLHEPNAMTLATATSDGRPSARVVLLKGFDERGFVFYTNYEGRKGRELEENPHCALVFYWSGLERQVRVEGRASRVPAEESDAYYRSRPWGSRLGAWASDQSRPVEDRAALEERLRELGDEYEGREVPRPPFWGGYRVEPEAIEFWQGRENRLHDRLLYRRSGGGGWSTKRLQP